MKSAYVQFIYVTENRVIHLILRVFDRRRGLYKYFARNCILMRVLRAFQTDPPWEITIL